MSALARTENVTKVYPVGQVNVSALRGVSIEIGEGEFVALVGASGSGKSTLLHILAALTQPTSGRVFLGDAEYGTLSDGGRTALRRQSIGIIFQRFNLLPTLDARGNIEIAREIAGVPPDAGHFARLIELLGIGDRLDHRPSQLSGGEQQRVAIARALIHRPKLLLADEPTGNLDSKNSQAVLDLLERLNRDFGQTTFLITHNVEAAAIAHRVLHMRDGLLAGA
jgi:putative ABC transport system ATP-binding protein